MTDKARAGGIRALVFDAGGVLIELGDPAELFGLAALERGAIDAETFARSIVAEAALPYGWREFLDRFMAWPGNTYPGIAEILDALPGSCVRAIMSNTNEKHWVDGELGKTIRDRFDYHFLSFETGLLKPDREAFEYVFRTLACTPAEIAFFDDNPANVDAAAALGCQARATRGAEGLRSALEEMGILGSRATRC